MSSANLELQLGRPQSRGQVDYASALDRRLPPYFRRKATLDRVLAIMLLAPGLPLMAILVILVRATSRGPAIFRQERVGRDGSVFTMYKLRSMTQDAEKGTGAVWAKAKDARVTKVGYVLRKLHLDELPQLFNVLAGEMSLIGPRPERPEFVEILAEEIPRYRERLAVLPGVTGLAQINLPPDTTLDDVRRKLVLDLEYVDQASFWLDVRMLACTLLRMVGVPGAPATRVTRVERRVELPESADFEAIGGDGAEALPDTMVERLDVEGNGKHSANGRNGNGTASHGLAGVKRHAK